jgi:hypothetical protein
MRHQGITDNEAYAAARPLNPAILLALLAANADVEPTDLAKRRTPLHLASSKGHHSYVLALLEAKSKEFYVNAKWEAKSIEFYVNVKCKYDSSYRVLFARLIAPVQMTPFSL